MDYAEEMGWNSLKFSFVYKYMVKSFIAYVSVHNITPFYVQRGKGEGRKVGGKDGKERVGK